MAVQVFLHLRLGLREEAQAPAIAHHSGSDPEREGPRIPERSEVARTVTKLVETLAAPREVVTLFGTCGL
ncbi:hypothetical protein D3C83_154450 [compost metagenome]